MEIERKYIVMGESWREKVTSSWRIQQGYLCDDPQRCVRVRLRMPADASLDEAEAFITIKSESDDGGLSRQEYEYSIPPVDASRMMRLCRHHIIHKIRHIIPVTLTLPEEGRTVDGKIEVDEFLDDNKGLILAEVELPDTKATFGKPDFLADEVTGVDRYYNLYLARNPYSSWF